jgi:hypothetical protein
LQKGQRKPKHPHACPLVDEVFGGAIEDATVIEDIYRVIAKYFRGGVLHDEYPN